MATTVQDRGGSEAASPTLFPARLRPAQDRPAQYPVGDHDLRIGQRNAEDALKNWGRRLLDRRSPLI